MHSQTIKLRGKFNLERVIIHLGKTTSFGLTPLTCIS